MSKKLLIANRGEIAIRIARTAKRMGFHVVGIYSTEDVDSEHLYFCDETIELPGITARETYLDIPKIIDLCRKHGVSFVHPGYGFLSEKAEFATKLSEAGITLVGPSADSMKRMGDKITARSTVDEVGVPRVPGSAGALKGWEEAETFAKKIGLPVLLKASAGGGGKGMRRVDRQEDVKAAFEGASREALSAFGDGSMYLEKWVLKPHHVEIQVFGDGKGKAIHLGERECSVQRRHQKIWEESPAPILEKFPDTRRKMEKDAVKIAEHIRYAGAGTMEFIVDEEGNYYFLEMNTRLQVEHPVTEWVTQVDLVEWQLELASNPKWEFPKAPPERRGASIEVRLYAEDPLQFLPSPGEITDVRFPSGPFVRVDSVFHHAGRVSMHYDPMIAKVSVWASDRASAIGRMKVALSETSIFSKPDSSLKTNLLLLQRLAAHPEMLKGNTPTDFIYKYPELIQEKAEEESLPSSVAQFLFQSLSAGDLR